VLRSVKELRGYSVPATNGEIGKVDEFYFDDKEWMIRYLVVDIKNWLAGRRVLISPIALGEPDSAGQMFPVTLTREEVENSPDVDTNKPVSRQKTVELQHHDAWPVYGWRSLGVPISPETASVYPGMPSKVDQRHHDNANLRSTREVTGYHIHAQDGEIGHVEDFVISDRSWSIQYVVVDTRNWLPGKKVLVAPQWIKAISWTRSKVYVDLLRETIKNSPEYDPSALVNQPSPEEAFYEHDGWPRNSR
jgi:sporulation protein YlmC with PRC-barrel domain